MAVDPHTLIAARDASGNVVELILFALFVIASIGSTIVSKLREREGKKAGGKPVIPPPDQPTLGRPEAPRPAIGRPAAPRRPAMARPGRPGPSPAELAARRERARAILLDEAPRRAPTPQPDSARSRPPARGKQRRQPHVTPHVQTADQVGSLPHDGSAEPPSSGTAPATAAAAKSVQAHPARRARITLSHNTLRDAIVYAEVLGAPRALRDEPRWSSSG